MNMRTNQTPTDREYQRDTPLKDSIVSVPYGTKAESSPLKEEHPQTTESLGSYLKKVREKRGDDLATIAERLRIRVSYLEALENNQYELLPVDAYVIGFLRTYSNFLGLDGKVTLDRYRQEMVGRRRKTTLLMPTPVAEGRTPSGQIILGALISVLVLYGLWVALSSSGHSPEKRSPPLPRLTQESPPSQALPTDRAPLPLIAMPPTNEPQAVPSPLATPPSPVTIIEGTDHETRVIIRAVQPSWISITNAAGKTVFDKVLKAGETYNVPNQKGLHLTTGNQNGLTVTVDGVSLNHISGSIDGHNVLRNVNIDPDFLKTHLTENPN